MRELPNETEIGDLKSLKLHPHRFFRVVAADFDAFVDRNGTRHPKTNCQDFTKISGNADSDCDDLADILAFLATDAHHPEHLEVLAYCREVFESSFLKAAAKQLSPSIRATLIEMIATLDAAQNRSGS